MGKKKKSSKDVTRESVYFDEDMDPVEVKMIPDDQLTLNDANWKKNLQKHWHHWIRIIHRNAPILISRMVRSNQSQIQNIWRSTSSSTGQYGTSKKAKQWKS